MKKDRSKQLEPTEKQKRSVRDTMRNLEKPHIEPAKAMNIEEIGEQLAARIKELRYMTTREELKIVNEACNSPMNIFEAGVMTGKIDTLVAQQKESALDTQVGGDHYIKHTIQPWDIIDEYDLGYYGGNALKYLLRDKGDRKEDLEKARHYIAKMIGDLK
jgi:hypothetical protein